MFIHLTWWSEEFILLLKNVSKFKKQINISFGSHGDVLFTFPFKKTCFPYIAEWQAQLPHFWNHCSPHLPGLLPDNNCSCPGTVWVLAHPADKGFLQLATPHLPGKSFSEHLWILRLFLSIFASLSLHRQQTWSQSDCSMSIPAPSSLYSSQPSP